MQGVEDLDSICAGLHGRHSRLAAGERLRALCGEASPRALAERLYPGAGLDSAAALQRRLMADYCAETARLAGRLCGARGRLLRWMAARPQLENIKVLVRRLYGGPGAPGLLLELAPGMACGAGSAPADMSALAAMTPEGPLREALAASYKARPESPAFLHEAALERAYYSQLAAALGALSHEDRASAGPLLRQELAAYNLALAARSLAAGLAGGAEEFFVPGSAIDRLRFRAMLAAGGLGPLRSMAAGRAVYAGPPVEDPALLDQMARRRYAITAARTWTADPSGFGAVAAYAALRRLETEDLARLSEGLRLGLAPGELSSLVGLEAHA